MSEQIGQLTNLRGLRVRSCLSDMDCVLCSLVNIATSIASPQASALCIQLLNQAAPLACLYTLVQQAVAKLMVLCHACSWVDSA